MHSVQRMPLLPALLLTLLIAQLCACSWTFDDSAPPVPLLGEAVLPDSFPKLNIEPARDALIMTDAQGNPWVAMPVAAPLTLTLPPPPPRDTVRLVRLDAGAPHDGRERKEVSADHTYIGSHVIYLIEPPPHSLDPKPPTEPTRVTAFFVGLSASAHMFMFPGGSEFLSANPTDAVFLYWAAKASDPRIFITRTDGSFQRAIAPPKGYDDDAATTRISFFFDSRGDHLFVQDGEHRMLVYSTLAEAMIDLGVQPTAYVFDASQKYLLFCDDAGLKRVAIDGSGASLLDLAPCDPAILRVSGGAAYLKSGADLRRVPLDGSSAPQVVIAGVVEQLLSFGPQGAILYSKDSPLTYGSGIGDGWFGDWQFMQRGRRPSFSLDHNRLRWLENAARSDGSGDLTSATISDHAVLPLARNVRTTTELADGRVLAISNAAFKGTQNRLITIDESTRTARWVVDSARDYLFIPGTSDLLVKIVVGQLGYDIRRVPVPPR